MLHRVCQLDMANCPSRRQVRQGLFLMHRTQQADTSHWTSGYNHQPTMRLANRLNCREAAEG